MNLLGLLVQNFFDRQAREQAEKFREAGMRAALKGRKLAIAGVFFGMATIFFLTAVIVFAIELGLQFDRSAGLSYSGLMLSSTLLGGLSVLAALAGVLISQSSSEFKVNAQPAPPPPRSNDLKEVIEEIALGFLKEFAKSQRPPSESEKP